MDKAIKTLNLGEINVYEDLKLDTPGEKHILNALAKANDTKEVKIDLSQLEAKDIKSTGAVIIMRLKKILNFIAEEFKSLLHLKR
ncbi:hypothetical protein HYE05_02730 [Mycoplasmopsis bovis]|nr:hypothetical protein [Mycoplasmopsis bovis]QQH27606.1 hypothetical protein HYE05_02730 [Mycoplasmopsis bovis]